MEQKFGRAVLSRDRVVFRTDPEQFGQLPSVVDLIREALGWLLHYWQSLDQPRDRADEEQRILELGRKADEIWQKHPERWVIETRILAFLRAGELVCGPSVNSILAQPEPQIVAVRGKVPLVGTPETTSHTRELILSFLRADHPTHRVDVLVDRGGTKNFVPTRWQSLAQFPTAAGSRKAREDFTAAVRKRVYLPEPLPTGQQLEKPLKDACALICLYLVQAKLLNLDEDVTVRDFLLSYLREFRLAGQVGESWILKNLLRFYQIPEDYRAWRKYVSKTIHGLAAAEQSQDRSYTLPGPTGATEYSMVPAIADDLGISRDTLYRKARAGQVRTKKVAVNARQYLTIVDSEIERLKKEQNAKQWRTVLIAAWAIRQGITRRSSRRWVERQKKGPEEIAKYIGEKPIQQAIRQLRQESEGRRKKGDIHSR